MAAPEPPSSAPGWCRPKGHLEMLIDCKACDCTAIAGDLERCPECGADLTASVKPEAAPKRPALAAAAPPKDAA